MQTKTLYSLILTATFSLGFVQNTFAFEHHGKSFEREIKRELGGMHFMKRAFAKLDLSEDQKAQLKVLKESGKNGNEQTREQIIDLKLKIKGLLSADVIDEAAVKSTSMELASLKSSQAIKHAKMRKQALAILTDEQRAKFEQMKNKRKMRMKKHLELSE